jgi:segregation and condensation protein A
MTTSEISISQLFDPAPITELPSFARLYGEPLFKMPQDLYIPPQALEIFLEAFEGPLDLLLYLIRKQNFNVLDIPMATVTQQYLRYVDEIRSRNLELAGEYLLMAAMLIEIKSRMLLPRPKADVDDPEDPRAELVRRLMEYEQFKQAAKGVDALPQLGRDFLNIELYVERSLEFSYPEVKGLDLMQAWADLIRRAKLTQHHTISREALSVREHMSSILKTLATHSFFEFHDLFDVRRGVPVLVVHFLALLELARERLVELTQADAFAPIYIRLSDTPLNTTAV